MTKNIMVGRKFKIVDCHKRLWGVFVVKSESVVFDEYNIQGILHPTDEFKLVHPLFIKHEKEMEKVGNVEDISVDAIIKLQPLLIDDVTHQEIQIQDGIIFITEDMIVTCGLDRDQTK